ncbi:MAG: hypothetical protein IMY70_06780 [Bacteroidetes bacterium]|nr:hypothetical protein [Bacteroidota bacterium]
MIKSYFRTLLFVVIILSCSNIAYSQYYSAGQDPFSVKWRQIKTDHFQIIYPDKNEKQAQYLANVLEVVYQHATRSLECQPKKISVFLHDYSVTSNAFVAWAPKRMELYTTPPQDSYAQIWLDQLALHEYRHVVQISKLNQGITKILSILLGEQGTAAILGLYVPVWFLEGDAVCIETALSYSGRGRSPGFEMTLKSQVLNKGIYSYDKAVYQSYKNFVPNNYTLGYNLVAYSRKRYGPGLWNTTLNTVAKRPYMIVPFSYGIKKTSGFTKVKLYQNIMKDLQEAWQEQESKSNYSSSRVITKAKKNYTSYTQPKLIGDSLILAIRTSIDDITRFVVINAKGEEEVLTTPGQNFRETLSFAKGKICWSEMEPDPRWANQSYAVIKTYDLYTGKVEKLTGRTRYFAPSLSPGGSMIAAVEVTPQSQYSIVILDASTGSLLKKIALSDTLFYMTPSWSENSRKIVTIVLGTKGKSIALVDTDNGEINLLIPFTYTDISKPVVKMDYIYFTGAYSGIDNIYSLNIATGDINQVISAKYGATDISFSPDGQHFIYADYTDDGYQVAESAPDTNLWIPLDEIEDHSLKLYKPITNQEGFVLNGNDIPTVKHISKRYSRFLNLFNIHSWAPLSINASNFDIKPGLSILSQNKLSTSFFIGGYEYNLGEKVGKYYLNYSYQGFYPIIDIRWDHGKRRDYYPAEKGKQSYEWKETNIITGIRIPLNLTRGKYYRGINPGIGFTQTYRKMQKSSQVKFIKSNIKSFDYRLYSYNRLKKSTRDIYPQWGQVIDIQYRHTPFDDLTSSIFAAETYLYFPGIIRHQGLRFYGGYQNRLTGYYKFSDLVNYPRGITGKQDEVLYSIAATYKMPILYPDFSLGPFVYLKRIKISLFYDYAIGDTDHHITYYKSTGMELSGDMHIIRFIAPFDIGLRVIYLPDQQKFEYQFLFAVGFDSFYIGHRKMDQ